MIEPRLSAEMTVKSLFRIVEQQDGFAMVIHKGDQISGSILIQCIENGENPRLLERMPSLEGTAHWQQIWPQDAEKQDNLPEYIERRRKFDPDLWLIELDIPDAERLVAQIGQ